MLARAAPSCRGGRRSVLRDDGIAPSPGAAPATGCSAGGRSSSQGHALSMYIVYIVYGAVHC